ncbi:unnamed protein product [Anisakis simplex]|uniref:JAKMIP_CC3 domain-containing protein n=1 Tax=Anisakis simplex TaxID=6269 RepID=A0A158PN07_ANISI|nr:unnamed protein product [Anisakis simplex]
MNREDHERERVRWQQRLDETENRLAEAEMTNSEMNQLKAELNKRIVEMERNQKPLIEQNRRLSERNRLLQNEIKKGEQRLCHSQDDFLTLKDGYEKLVKENQTLKEKRAFPEKLEELDRAFVEALLITVMYAKEKDRRYELLVQKFKRLRKCVLPRRNGESEDDRQSSFGGSDCSAESSISLDTITENFSEVSRFDNEFENSYQHLAREHDELQRALSALKITTRMTTAYEDDQLVGDRQLECARASQQHLTDELIQQPENTTDLLGAVTRLQDQLIALQTKCERLERELSDSNENKELLEFQLLEANENMKHELEESLARRKGHDKMIETDKWIAEDGDDKELLQIALTLDQTCDLKRDLLQLYKSANLDDCQRKNIRQAKLYIEFLENVCSIKQSQLQGLLEMGSDGSTKIKDYELKKTENDILIADLREQIQGLRSVEKQKMELEVEVERLHTSVAALNQEKQVLLDKISENSSEVKKPMFDNTANNEGVKDLEKELMKKLNATDEQKASLLHRIEALEKEKQELLMSRTELQQEMNVLTKSVAESNDRISSLTKANQDAKIEQNAEKLARICQEKADIEEMNSKLRERMNALIEENQKLKEEIRPAIKTQLERRFEESRFRLNSALQTIHEHENEIAKLRTQVDELQQKLNDRNKIESDLVQAREYSEQLQKQFSTQALIIDALKEKIILHKNFDDVLSAAIDECEQSCEDIENKLGILCQSKENNLTHESIALLRRLIRVSHSMFLRHNESLLPIWL